MTPTNNATVKADQAAEFISMLAASSAQPKFVSLDDPQLDFAKIREEYGYRALKGIKTRKRSR
jgi:hypothetical protein